MSEELMYFLLMWLLNRCRGTSSQPYGNNGIVCMFTVSQLSHYICIYIHYFTTMYLKCLLMMYSNHGSIITNVFYKHF